MTETLHVLINRAGRTVFSPVLLLHPKPDLCLPRTSSTWKPFTGNAIDIILRTRWCGRTRPGKSQSAHRDQSFSRLTWNSESYRRIMSETLTKLDNLSKTIRASARIVSHEGIYADVQHRDWKQKSFVEIKPVPVVKHVKIWQYSRLPR